MPAKSLFFLTHLPLVGRSEREALRVGGMSNEALR